MPVRSRSAALVGAAPLLLFSAFVAHAPPLRAQQQQVSIRGRVIDRGTARPLGDALVALAERRVQATTDENGVFTLRDVPPGAYTISVRLIGYSPAQRRVTVIAGQTATADVSLEKAVIQLDQVVVTGTAGATSKREIGNALSSVSVSALTDQVPFNNVQEVLNARTPGLTLTSNSGLAGAASNVTIRGAGSLNAGYQPVYYIDGIRFEAAQVSTGGVTNSTVQYSSPLDFIDPADIERIEVIKGPAAATLYGADAAGGVIQIITKKGFRGANRVQWDVTVGTSSSALHVDMPINYYQCNAAKIRNPGTYPGCADPSSVTFMSKHGPVTGIPESDIMRFGDSLFVLKDDPLARDPRALRTGQGSELRISARGGSQNFGYFVSANRTTDEGIFFNNFQNRTGGRANFDFSPNSKAQLGVDFSFTQSNGQMPLSDNASNGLLRNSMRGKARATKDPWESGWFGFGPAQTNEFDLRPFEERTTLGINTSYTPFTWLESRLVLGMDKYDRRDQTFYRVDSTLKWGATAGTGDITQRLALTHMWTLDYNGTATMNVTRELQSRASAGVQLNKRQFHRYTAEGMGLVSNNVNLVGTAANTQADEGFSEQTGLGVYVQDRLGWRDRLFATGAVRVDNNSAFGSDFKYVLYPKASLSYVVSDESFFHVPHVDELKLRAAWGRAGNAPAPFSADRTFSSGVATTDAGAVNALAPSEFGNPDLKPETGDEIEVGFDASGLAGRIGLEVTYYNQHTKDALMSIPDPPSSGFTGTHLVNLGEVANAGLELLATATPIRGRLFSWDATLSLTTNKNKLVSFGGSRDEIAFGAFTNSQRHREGYPLGGFWGVDVIRDASGKPVLDANGSAQVDQTCTWPDPVDPTGFGGSCHEKYLGPATPTREVAFSNTLRFRENLSLFVNLDYKGGNWLVCAICSIRNRINTNTWETANPNVDPAEQAVWLSTQTMTHIFRADYLKLREVSLNFIVPRSWGGPFAANRYGITLSGRNLGIPWTKYKGTGDPEVSFTSSPGTFDHTDYAAVPAPRQFSATLHVTF
jgi:TonB-linked SusC/RagA family outer membrane protein